MLLSKGVVLTAVAMPGCVSLGVRLFAECCALGKSGDPHRTPLPPGLRGSFHHVPLRVEPNELALSQNISRSTKLHKEHTKNILKVS